MTRTVANIMVRDLVTINEEDNLSQLAHTMDRFRLRHLPVVNGKKLVGLVSHRDLLRLSMSTLLPATIATSTESSLKEKTFVAEVMTRDLVCVHPSTSLAQAVRLMLKNKFGCLPVVNDGDELVGIISEQDLLRELASDLDIESENEQTLTRSLN